MADKSATHPEKLNQFSCEQCGTICDADDGVSREDEGGVLWSLCPDCAGEYRKVILEQDGTEWVLKKANYHEIDRFRSRSKARRTAEDIAFIVDIVREDI